MRSSRLLSGNAGCLVYFLVLPTRSAVASMSATVFMSLGWTLPGGIRLWVTSSSFSSRSTSAIESMSPGGHQRGIFIQLQSGLSDELRDLFEHLLRFRCHSACLMPLVTNLGCSCNNFSRVVERAGLPAVLFTIHFGGFKKTCAHGHSHCADYSATNLALRFRSARCKWLSSSTSATTTMSSVPRLRIEESQSDRAAVVNRRMAADDLFDVLRINIFAADDQQIFLAADDIQFTVEQKSQIASVIPAVANALAP